MSNTYIYIAFFDFYSIIIGVYDNLEEAIKAARTETGGWVERWEVGVKGGSAETVWR